MEKLSDGHSRPEIRSPQNSLGDREDERPSEIMLKVGIAIATYKRPDDLQKLLQSLSEAEIPDGVELRIAVADNDPLATGRTAALESKANSSHPILYAVQPFPGIAHTRNATVRMLPQSDFIAFVDDDEWVHREWLKNLLSAADDSGADLVHGPVEYLFQSPPKKWMLHGGFYITEHRSEGALMPFAATNNLLVRRTVLDQFPEGPFDTRFSLTGGSDTMLTALVAQQGAKIVWTNKAVVYEVVPSDRVTRRWVFRRAIRTGNTLARVKLYTDPSIITRVEVILGGLARIISALPLFVVAIGNHEQYGAAVRRFARGAGMLGASSKMTVVEYKRPIYERDARCDEIAERNK